MISQRTAEHWSNTDADTKCTDEKTEVKGPPVQWHYLDDNNIRALHQARSSTACYSSAENEY